MSRTFHAKRPKYGNKKTAIDGITFDSKKEAARYCALKLLVRAGEISDLELQQPFVVKVNNKKICVYKADFAYQQNGRRIIEDVKGIKTPVYRLKKKLVEAQFEVEITEI